MLIKPARDHPVAQRGGIADREHRRDHGQRLPTGTNNLQIQGRFGSGTQGNLPARGTDLQQIDAAIADKALAMLDVDPQGFDVMDRKLLEAVVHRFDGGPVGLDNIAASIGEERDTIEDVIEPYLIQQGFLQRTPRGRVATLAAYRHLGVAPPATEGGLFSAES